MTPMVVIERITGMSLLGGNRVSHSSNNIVKEVANESVERACPLYHVLFEVVVEAVITNRPLLYCFYCFLEHRFAIKCLHVFFLECAFSVYLVFSALLS